MIKNGILIMIGIGFLVSSGVILAGTQVTQPTINVNLCIANNSINRDFVSLPNIQLSVNTNLQSKNVTYSGLSNFYVVNEIKYNTSTMDDNGNIVNQFIDILTLCPKTPGNYTVSATIKNGNETLKSNLVNLSFTPTVCTKLQKMINMNSKQPSQVNKVSVVTLSNPQMLACTSGS